MRGRFKRVGAFGALLVLTWLTIVSIQIVQTGRPAAVERADVAIILGAAAYGTRPSPVFEERIKHGIALYRTKQVQRLLFTGGYGFEAELAESEVGRRYAIREGVPAQAILVETHSHTTRENIIYARRLMIANNLNDALIVSDPLHLKRALRMARDLQVGAHAAPTPTTPYRSWSSKLGFLLREIYFYNHYLLTGQ